MDIKKEFEKYALHNHGISGLEQHQYQQHIENSLTPINFGRKTIKCYSHGCIL